MTLTLSLAFLGIVLFAILMGWLMWMALEQKNHK
jgi:hypothetical protein